MYVASKKWTETKGEFVGKAEGARCIAAGVPFLPPPTAYVRAAQIFATDQEPVR